MRFEQSTQTPEAFANSSPGLERSDNPGVRLTNSLQTLKGFLSRRTLSGLIVIFRCRTQGCRYAPTLG
jgi:hypothetical protein